MTTYTTAARHASPGDRLVSCLAAGTHRDPPEKITRVRNDGTTVTIELAETGSFAVPPNEAVTISPADDAR